MNRIVNLMIERRLISEDEKELYLYGLQLLAEKLLGLFSMLFICVLMSRVLEGTAFYLFYSLLRKYAGGFHAGKFVTCYLSSCFTVFACCMLCCLPFLRLASVVIAVIVTPVIIHLAPVEHSAKPLDLCEKKRYRGLVWIILLCELGAFVLFFTLGWDKLCFAISFAWALLSALLIIQTIKNRKSI